MTATGRAAAPSGCLLALTVVVVAAFTILRFWAAATLDLRSDEAYYWTWSQQWVLSYLDHPPMVAWFEKLGIALFGNTPLGARFAQLVTLPIIEILLADIARRRLLSWNAALFVVLAMECTLNYGLFSIVVEPSIPLLLFVSTILWGLCRLDETDDARWWLLIGVAGGLALLSKYIVLLLAPALLVFLLLDTRHRRWLATVWPYAAVVIAIVLFSPVLVWNARHDWASFAFQSVRLGTGHGLNAIDPLRFVIYETLWVGPVLVLASVAGASVLLVRASRRRQAFEAAIAIAFLAPFAFLLFRSLTLQINQSWAWFVWPLGILALALALPWARVRLGVAVLAAAVVLSGVPLVGGLFFHIVADRSVWFGRGDPFGQDAGFDEAAQRVLAQARESGAVWVATTDYRTYANLLWHIGDEIPVLQVNERVRFADFVPRDPAGFKGPALYVHPGAPHAFMADKRLTPLAPVQVTWRGVEMQALSVDRLEGYTPELTPEPGLPAYAVN